MKEIKLLSLRLRNFKGCAEFFLPLNGASASIYGDNATGKTTIYDGLTWLLFGKDSRGRNDFEIKPLDRDGNVEDHAAVTEVAASFDVAGEQIGLKRTYFEKWSTKRGAQEATYDGNTSEYYIDDVPVKKNDYDRQVGELVDEDLFRTLTSVSWFCEGMPWKERRKLLMSVCEAPDDREILASDARFAPLLAEMGRLGVEDYRKKLLAKRKGLSGARSTIPARLDEQQRTVAELRTIDFEGLSREWDKKNERVQQLSEDAVKLDHGTLLDSKRNEMRRLQNDLDALEVENDRHRASQKTAPLDPRPALEAALRAAKESAESHRRAADLSDREAHDRKDTIAAYRQEWNRVDGKTFQQAACPTCGQKLTGQLLEKARTEFVADKERQKLEFEKRAGREKDALNRAEQNRDLQLNGAKAAQQEVERLTRELEHCAPANPVEIRDLSDYRTRRDALTAQIDRLESEVAGMYRETVNARNDINGQIGTLREELAAIQRDLAKRYTLEAAEKREAELRQEAKAAAEELEAVDKQLALCEAFTRHKVSVLEGRIDGKFTLTHFKMFEEQVNGGLVDCCEATYQGVPYGSLNNGMRINVGVDVIRTISDFYGLQVPLFVDNAESVTNLMDAGTQVIRLVVSEQDKILRCET